MNKILKYNLSICLTILIIANSCNDMIENWYAIKVVNKTSKAIYVSSGCPRDGMYSFPDTILPTAKPSLTKVSPNDFNVLRSSFPWEKVVKDNPSDSLSIYIFDPDTLNAYDWRLIKEGYKILKRYDLSLEDLKKSNWTIAYPK